MKKNEKSLIINRKIRKCNKNFNRISDYDIIMKCTQDSIYFISVFYGYDLEKTKFDIMSNRYRKDR